MLLFKQNISQNDPISCLSQIFFPFTPFMPEHKLPGHRESMLHSQGLPHRWGFESTFPWRGMRTRTVTALMQVPRMGSYLSKWLISAWQGLPGSCMSQPKQAVQTAGPWFPAVQEGLCQGTYRTSGNAPGGGDTRLQGLTPKQRLCLYLSNDFR